MSQTKKNYKIITQNKKAFHDYEVIRKIESGIVLLGSEVKSLRYNNAAITQSYALHRNKEFFLYGSNIPEYNKSQNFSHVPTRVRKLMMHKKEIYRIINIITKKGYTLIPLALYFNHKNIVKISLGIVKGIKFFDKREIYKQKKWQQEKHMIITQNQVI